VLTATDPLAVVRGIRSELAASSEVAR
jgi:hypothetical protein